MKKILFTLALLVSFSSFGQTAEKSFINNSMSLKDSQEIDVNLKLTSVIEKTKIVVDKERSQKLKSNALMKVFSTTNNNIIDVVSYVNRVSEGRKLGYWNTLTENEMQYSGYYKNVYGNRLYTSFRKDKVNYITDPGYLFNGKTTLFYKFFKRLFNSETARNILFKTALNVVLNHCENYPKDFTIHIISELNNLLKFCDSIKTTSISQLEKTNYNGNYWKGFIARRIIYNNLSVKEVKSLLTSAVNKLKKIDISKLPDVYYTLTINDSVSISFDKSFYYLNSLNSGKRIKINYYNEPHTIKYFEDRTNSLYVFKFKDKKGRFFENIYDKNLNIIK